ncbi:MAG: hypothetical protein C0392_08030 [Syntrophus sp. (in: bacteria)]|nr:hypothetical protein [Syntrophus sp. (in: bacteria)]
MERISWLKTRIQENLFPHLRECLDDPLTEKQKDLIMILEVIEIERYVTREQRKMPGDTRRLGQDTNFVSILPAAVSPSLPFSGKVRKK